MRPESKGDDVKTREARGERERILERTHSIENTFYREHILERTHSRENTFCRLKNET
jgi:hypothetical protein